MGDFFRSIRFKILAAILLLLFGVLLNSAVRNGWAGAVEGAIGTIIAPLQKVSTSIANATESFFKNFQDKKKLQQNYKLLEEENNNLINQLKDFAEYKRENEQMKGLLQLQESNPDFVYCLSEIIGKEHTQWFETFTIDKGYLDGIAPDDPVITKDMEVVGRITKVGPTWSTISTVFNTDTNIGAYLSTSRESGVLISKQELSVQNLLRVDFLPKGCGASKGELVVTSGLGGIFPKGLIIGMIEDVGPSDDGLTVNAVVRPKADIDAIKDVFVVTSFRGQQSELDNSASSEAGD